MIVLACETSTLLGSVAVLKDQAVLAYKDSFRQGSHSEVLNVFIESVLAEAGIGLGDVDLFATGIGPGSFTGIRISLNAIKAFSFCYQKPCVGVDSLINMAYQCSQQSLEKDLPIVVMINAYKNMVYVATYHKQGEMLLIAKEPSVVRVQNLTDYIQTPSYVIGDGYIAYKAYLDQHLADNMIRPENPTDWPQASILGELAVQKKLNQPVPWNELLPLYLRESEAEENIKGIKYQPLF